MNQTVLELPNAPRLPGVVRRWFASHPKTVDRIIAYTYLGASLVALVLEMFVLGIVLDAAGATPPLPYGWVLVIEVVTMGVTFWMLLLRRSRPLVGLTVVSILSIVSVSTSIQSLADGVAQLYLLYAVPVFGTVKRGWIGYAIVGVTVWLQILVDGELATVWPTWIVSMLMSLVVLLIAINLGNRRRYIDALVERAEMLERDRDQLARISVARERERISREMHDIVAHSISVMIALSEGAARAVESTPDRATDAMHRSAETGRTALTQMRRLMAGLSNGDNDAGDVDLLPQPGVADLNACIEQFREAGVDVLYTATGDAPDDGVFSLTVYRVVQEALTNVLRYAGIGSRAEVTVVYGAETTDISVRDYGRMPGHIVQDQVGSGSGLRGLTERIRMFGGTMMAGNAPGHGWIVRVSLPTTAISDGQKETQP